MTAGAFPEGGPLRDTFVLDLSAFLAGPFCGQILADLGARVVKIEPPSGDMTRGIPPYFVDGESAYYLSANRNKESLVLDLKQDEGRSILHRLIEHADIVLESNRPSVAERIGLGFDAVHKTNPRAVLISITGFGQDGPYRDRPAYDAIVQALSGVMSVTGEEDGLPVRTGVPLGDLAAGMFAAIGGVAGVLEARASGVGRHIDVAMLDAQISLLSYLAVYYLVSGDVPSPQGRGHVSIPTYRSFVCADGVMLIVTANTEQMWRKLCDALGHGEWIDDPRFRTAAERLANREQLGELLEECFRRDSSDEWLQRLTALEIPVAPINTLDKALSDPHVLSRQIVWTMTNASGVSFEAPGNPIRVIGNDSAEPRWPPRLGEHSGSILRELLQFDDGAIAELVKNGVVATGPASVHA